jgi:steroid Delta-isomerase
MSRDVANAIADWYERLSPESLDDLRLLYTEDAYFKDPFHEFRDRERLLHIYRGMLESLHEPRFEVPERIVDGDQAVLIWRFRFRFRGRPWCIRGSTHLGFQADGRVDYHRDYWDAAEELYEKVPLLGTVLGLLRRRIGRAGRQNA